MCTKVTKTLHFITKLQVFLAITPICQGFLHFFFYYDLCVRPTLTHHLDDTLKFM